MTLLMAISLFPTNAALNTHDASGALVPIATIVKPIITEGTFNNLAKENCLLQKNLLL